MIVILLYIGFLFLLFSFHWLYPSDPLRLCPIIILPNSHRSCLVTFLSTVIVYSYRMQHYIPRGRVWLQPAKQTAPFAVNYYRYSSACIVSRRRRSIMASPPLDTDAGSHINGQNLGEERDHTRNPSLELSDHDSEENEDDNAGDYSTRMGELFEEDDDEEAHEDDDDDDDEEGFIYTGMDTDNSAGDYRSQLRDVLGPELEEDHTEELEVERSLILEENEKAEFGADDLQVCVWRVIRDAALRDLLSSYFLCSMVMLPRTVHHPRRLCIPRYFLPQNECHRQWECRQSFRNRSFIQPSRGYAPTRFKPRKCLPAAAPGLASHIFLTGFPLLLLTSLNFHDRRRHSI